MDVFGIFDGPGTIQATEAEKQNKQTNKQIKTKTKTQKRIQTMEASNLCVQGVKCKGCSKVQVCATMWGCTCTGFPTAGKTDRKTP